MKRQKNEFKHLWRVFPLTGLIHSLRTVAVRWMSHLKYLHCLVPRSRRARDLFPAVLIDVAQQLCWVVAAKLWPSRSKGNWEVFLLGIYSWRWTSAHTLDPSVNTAAAAPSGVWTGLKITCKDNKYERHNLGENESHPYVLVMTSCVAGTDRRGYRCCLCHLCHRCHWAHLWKIWLINDCVNGAGQWHASPLHAALCFTPPGVFLVTQPVSPVL